MSLTIRRNEGYAQISDSMDSLSPKIKKPAGFPADLLLYFYFIGIMHNSLPNRVSYLAFAMSKLEFILGRRA
jgi:hypothetical protein